MRSRRSPEYLWRIPCLEGAIGDDLLVRLLAGAAVAGAIAAGARRTRALTGSGQWAAVVSGGLATAAGWWWAATLIAFFGAASALTRWRSLEKARRTASSIGEERGRNASQVIANGGLFVLCALGWRAGGGDRFAFAALGALAAASSDTWSTEVGTLLGGTPRLITTGQPIEPGMSGGVSAAGFGAGIAGALFVALLGSLALPQPRTHLAAAAAIGGFAGCLADSVIGATAQSTRFCDHCGRWTERGIHTCGSATRHARGIRWISNDAVNFCGTLAGAVITVLAGAVMAP